jgi:hypothetical protein
MLNMEYWTACSAPDFKKFSDISFRVLVISLAQPGIVHTLLHINYYERSVLG